MLIGAAIFNRYWPIVSSALTEVRPRLSAHEPQHGDANDDPVDRKWRKPSLSHPVHEPCDYAQRHDEGNHEADDEHGPLMGVDGHAAQRFSAVFGVKSFQQIITGGGDHGG